MLTIIVPEAEGFDNSTQEFTKLGGTLLELEHSLVSLSKWESFYEVPFLGKKEKTPEQILMYVKMMILTPNVSDDVIGKMDADNFKDINDYIDAKMTATWFSSHVKTVKSTEIITSELIYYWMTVFHIPFTCENWHLNRLLVLIQICNEKQAKPKKLTRAEIAARNRELNEKRKKELGTKG